MSDHELANLREQIAALEEQFKVACEQFKVACERSEQWKARAEKAEAFKTWTHAYLDTHGVPHHPPRTHGAEGCRIGDRMDWLMAKIAALEKQQDLLREGCAPCPRCGKTDCTVQAAFGRSIDAQQEAYDAKQEAERLQAENAQLEGTIARQALLLVRKSEALSVFADPKCWIRTRLTGLESMLVPPFAEGVLMWRGDGDGAYRDPIAFARKEATP